MTRRKDFYPMLIFDFKKHVWGSLKRYHIIFWTHGLRDIRKQS
jgi:hypothetical protein